MSKSEHFEDCSDRFLHFIQFTNRRARKAENIDKNKCEWMQADDGNHLRLIKGDHMDQCIHQVCNRCPPSCPPVLGELKPDKTSLWLYMQSCVLGLAAYASTHQPMLCWSINIKVWGQRARGASQHMYCIQPAGVKGVTVCQWQTVWMSMLRFNLLRQCVWVPGEHAVPSLYEHHVPPSVWESCTFYTSVFYDELLDNPGCSLIKRFSHI